jgi:outer membrane protein TolC
MALLATLAAAACGTPPQPIETTALAAIAEDRMARVTAGQEPVSGSIDVFEAIARALKYNLDQRVELMQEAVKLGELTLATQQGLPAIVASSGYAGRDNTLASSSQSVLTGRQSLEPSTSTSRENVLGDLALSWNILDFGLSYVRSRQAADQLLIQQEARRKALNRIVEDVRTAYWRTAASERLLSRLGALEGRTRKAIADARALATERSTPPVAALSYERELLEIRREAQRIEGELRVSRGQLAALMNLPPDAPFRLKAAPTPANIRLLDIPPRKLVGLALVNRPEMRELAYRARINERELDAALLELLPGLNAVIGANTDSNRFLFHSSWVGWGVKASWNLMKIAQYPAKKELIDAQGRLIDQRSLALAMAVMTQVHVSRARFVHARKELDTARRIRDLQRRLLQHVAAAAATDRTGEQALIREEMNLIVAEVRHDLAYANMQNAVATIYASLGLDVVPAFDLDRVAVSELARALRKTWVAHGDLSQVAAQQVAGPPDVLAAAAHVAPSVVPEPPGPEFR